MKKLILMLSLSLVACTPSDEELIAKKLLVEMRAANDAWAGEKASLMMGRGYASEDALEAATKRLHKAKADYKAFCAGDHGNNGEACIKAEKAEK
jgi:hypothetical protein